ncbi:fibronectin type III domain-containing protein 9 [Alosa alosa]|uniref:fibronectin type III domain-containing protein 9 n=1 Tax=Alosa alosa TaxID=278164 RepID=UPI0020153333|nr:fibronectin type III domain-containing protein 9 [Alosa alosa]
MPITVQNITATSAIVSWPSAPVCLDTFYSIMYHPNWNSLLMGYTRKSFLREDRVPVSQTTTLLGNLSPQTTYILCVSCKSAANPVRGQCQVFNTLYEGAEMSSGRRDLAMGVWLASSLLLLVIAVVLLWGCLYSMCPGQGQQLGEGGNCPAASSPHQGQTLVPGGRGGGGGGGGGAVQGAGDIRDSSFYTPSCSEEEEEKEEDSQQDRVLANPSHMEQGGGVLAEAETQGHELGRLLKNSNGSPN